ncbi:AAA family ATPase [Halomonas sp. E19]|uniref:AAA family ATPase n=1 Tax=Halomonas sp. E19 TaxID=3397247 RepID=UPI00403441D8
MKILALRLANLASLPGPLELDFTAPPLSDAGLFAITGPTGAGKSTLLDALCLALYGSTPRLRHAPSQNAPLPDVEGETVSTADPRTLLRRGTAGGYAEVDFLGRDGRRYRARWAVRRAREKASGRLQAVEQSLTDLDDERLLTAQKREFAELLPERLGLTFDQFTRAVLLAQSEFAAFLKADDNERSDLLERLTGTAEYSRISEAAYRRAITAKRHVDALQAKLADDLPAEPEARSALERQAESAEQALTDLQQQARSSMPSDSGIAPTNGCARPTPKGFTSSAMPRIAGRRWPLPEPTAPVAACLRPSATTCCARPRCRTKSPRWSRHIAGPKRRSSRPASCKPRPSRPGIRPPVNWKPPARPASRPNRACARRASTPRRWPAWSVSWPNSNPAITTAASRQRHWTSSTRPPRPGCASCNAGATSGRPPCAS